MKFFQKILFQFYYLIFQFDFHLFSVFFFFYFIFLKSFFVQIAEGTADVKIGRLIALLVEEGEDWENVTIPVQGVEDSSPSPAAAAPPPPPPAAAPAAAPAVDVVSKAEIEEIHAL